MKRHETSDPAFLDGQTTDYMERTFRDEHPFVWTATLIGPFVFTVGLLIVIGAIAGIDYVQRLGVMTLASMWLFGRFIILGGADPDVAQVAGAMDSWELFAMVLYLDVAVAMVLACHLGFLYRLPYVGPKLEALVVDGHFILDRHAWIRKATFLGLITFVAFPLAATGSVGGSIFGRLLGLSRWLTFWGIVIGSLVGDSVMLIASDVAGEYLDKDHPAVKYGGLAVVVGIIVLLEWRYRRMRHEFVSDQSSVPREGSETNQDRPIE